MAGFKGRRRPGGSGGRGPPGRGGQRRDNRPRAPPVEWVPRTRLGKLVKDGTITNISDALASPLKLREPEIVDILLPDLEDTVIDINMVQRMTDSGRRVRFAVTTAVGNNDGYVGIGRVKGKEVGPTIRRSIDNAKTNLIEVKRGCGSWECGCGKAHTLPFMVKGRCGSVDLTLKPAPQGIGLAIGDVPKPLLKFAGISDVWGFTRGHTKTTVNNILAAFDALQKTSQIRVTAEQQGRLKIISGACGTTGISKVEADESDAPAAAEETKN